jgi:hypothetical protein
MMVFGRVVLYGIVAEADTWRITGSDGGGGGNGLCTDGTGRGLCAEDETIVLGAGDRVSEALLDG